MNVVTLAVELQHLKAHLFGYLTEGLFNHGQPNSREYGPTIFSHTDQVSF